MLLQSAIYCGVPGRERGVRDLPVTSWPKRREEHEQARRRRRSAPTTSAACCGRPELLQAREDFAAGPDHRRRAAGGGGRGDRATRCGCRRTSACSPPPTASSAARPGTWTSSTSSTASTRRDEQLKVEFHNEQGDDRVHARRAQRRRAGSGCSKTIFGDDFAALQSMTTTATPKLTIPSPSMVHYRGGRAAIDADVYPDLDEFWGDLDRRVREEVRRLGELGCTYLQFDDTSLAYLNDPKQREYVASIGGDRRAPARALHPPHQRGARRTGPRA